MILGDHGLGTFSLGLNQNHWMNVIIGSNNPIDTMRRETIYREKILER